MNEQETNHQDNQPTNYGACFSPSNISGSSVYLDQGPYDNYKGMIDEEEICFKIRNIKDNEGEKITNFSRSSSINNEEHAKETISVDSQKCGLKVADFLPETPQNENEFNQSYNTKDSNVSYSTSEMISSTFNKMKKDAEIDKLTNGQQQNSHSSLDKIFGTTNRLKNFDKERPISNQLYRTYNDSIRNLELKSNEKESLASFGFMKPGVLQDQSDRNKHLKSRLVPHSLLKNQVNKRNDVFSNTFSKTINDFGNNSRMTRKDQDRKLSHTGNETPNVSHLKKFHDKMEKSYESCSKKKEDFITKKQTEDNKSHVAPDVKRLSPYNHRKIIDLKATSKSDMGFPNSSLLKSNYFQDKARQNNKILGHNENNLHDLNSVPNNYSKNKNLSTISNFESNRDSNVPSRAASIFSTSSSNHDTNFKSILEPLRSNVTSRRQSLSCLNKDNNEHQCIQYNEGERTPIYNKSNRKLSLLTIPESFHNTTIASMTHLDINSRLETPYNSSTSSSPLKTLNKEKNNKFTIRQRLLLEKSMNVAKTGPTIKEINNFITPMAELDSVPSHSQKDLNKEMCTPESKLYDKTKVLNDILNGLKPTKNLETEKNIYLRH
uniref:Uncharacterized protein n=1 Tax=Lepeophtheirus salmonis TaxID=72036 RepID=A0A0K2URK5_LEPSM